MRTPRLALALLALAAGLVLSPVAHASTSIDVRGSWTLTVNGSYTLSETFATEDLSSGAITGSGSGNGYSWNLSGTLTGSQLVYTEGPYAGGYTSTITATVSSDGSSYTGTWKDSNGTTGSVNGVRTALLPGGGGGGGGGGTGPTGKGMPPSLWKTVCVSIWIGDCTGFLPPPDPLQVCVSAWQDCNGFGGSKPAKPGTIDMSGFPAAVKTPVTCEQAPAASKSARASKQDRSISDNPDLRCKLDIYLNDKSKTRNGLDDEFQYEQNLRLFQAQVDSAKGQLVSSMLGIIGRMQVPDAQAPPRFFITAGTVWQAAIQQLYENAKERGKPVQVAEPANAGACAALADPSVCIDLVNVINKSATTDLQRLADLKQSLGVDVPFKQPKVKGTSYTAAAKRARVRRVLAFGSVTLKQGKRGTLRLKFTKRTRQALRKQARAGRRTIRVRLTIDAELQPGLHTTLNRTVKLVLRH